jgi:hypothetical protein
MSSCHVRNAKGEPVIERADVSASNIRCTFTLSLQPRHGKSFNRRAMNEVGVWEISPQQIRRLPDGVAEHHNPDSPVASHIPD